MVRRLLLGLGQLRIEVIQLSGKLTLESFEQTNRLTLNLAHCL